jgi:SNF2 family DNA or RNA helicase
MSKLELELRKKFENVILDRSDMHDYQDKKAVEFLRANPFSALFVDMGLGKTICSATLISDLLMDFLYDKVLIIGPGRVVTSTWPTEFGLWQHTAWMNFQVLHVSDDDPRLKEAAAKARSKARVAGASQKEIARLGGLATTAEKNRIRESLARSKPTIHLVSRDWVEWLVELWGPKWPYRAVFVDESSGFKDHKSGRFKALAKVRNTPGLIERLHILTATPAAEGCMGLFSQMFLVDRGERLGNRVTKFQKEYFTENKYSRKWKINEGAEDKILQLISDVCLVMKAKDYLNVDVPTIRRRFVDLTEDQAKMYHRMETDFVVTLDDGTEIEAETAAALCSKLLQMASGVLYETVLTPNKEEDSFNKSTKIHHLHDHKIDELKQIVEEAQGEPILVSYHFKASLDRLKKAFPKAVVMDRDGKAVRQWNVGKIPMLLMHPQSGGHGLNLQQGGHLMVFFDIPWSLELFLQMIGRLARQGQKFPVLVQLLLARGTADEDVANAIENKEDAQENFFVKLKRFIASRKRVLTNNRS